MCQVVECRPREREAPRHWPGLQRRAAAVRYRERHGPGGARTHRARGIIRQREPAGRCCRAVLADRIDGEPVALAAHREQDDAVVGEHLPLGDAGGLPRGRAAGHRAACGSAGAPVQPHARPAIGLLGLGREIADGQPVVGRLWQGGQQDDALDAVGAICSIGDQAQALPLVDKVGLGQHVEAQAIIVMRAGHAAQLAGTKPDSETLLHAGRIVHRPAAVVGARRVEEPRGYLGVEEALLPL